MNRDLSYKLVMAANKDQMLDLFLRLYGFDSIKISSYLAGYTVPAPLTQLKVMICIEDCVDLCQRVMLNSNVSYIALAGALLQQLNHNMWMRIPSEVEDALSNIINCCSMQEKSPAIVEQVRSIFESCKYLGQYAELIAAMIADVYAVHEGIGYFKISATDNCNIVLSV